MGFGCVGGFFCLENSSLTAEGSAVLQLALNLEHVGIEIGNVLVLLGPLVVLELLLSGGEDEGLLQTVGALLLNLLGQALDGLVNGGEIGDQVVLAET